MRLVALVGGLLVCVEWAYKGVDVLMQKWVEVKAGHGRRVSSTEGLLNGYLKNDR